MIASIWAYGLRGVQFRAGLCWTLGMKKSRMQVNGLKTYSEIVQQSLGQGRVSLGSGGRYRLVAKKTKKNKNHSTQDSRVVPHRGTN